MSPADAAGGTAAREALVRQLLARAGEAAAVQGPVRPPGRSEERRLAVIWEEVLERTAIGADDDYFALGGDSIAAVAVVSRARAAGIPLTTQDLFELRTVRAITAALKGPTSSRLLDRPGTGRTAGRTGLTPLQQGILYQSLADPSGTTQLVQVTAQLSGDIDVERFSDACRIVARRHHALRTAIGWDDTGNWMVVTDDAILPVRVVDLREVSATAQPDAVAEEIRGDLSRGMDLRTPPLARVMLLRLADDVMRFVLTHHHLVLDGWSQQIVLGELLDLYDGVDPSALPAPDDGLPEHRAWLRRLDEAAGAARWRELLAGFRPARVTGRPVGIPTGSRAVAVVGRTPDITEDARRRQVTPATLVYAAWSIVVAQLTGTDDVAVGVTLSGRPAMLPRASGAVGMFISTLPLRVRTAPDEGLPSWLHRVQRGQRELEDLQHCALTDIARAASGGQVAEPTGLFDTIVVVENFPELVADGTRSRRLRITSVAGSVWEGYPLVLEAGFGPQGVLLLRGDASVVPEELVRGAHAAMLAVLQALSTAETVADLRAHAGRHLSPELQPGRTLRETRRQVVSGPPDREGTPA